MQNSFTHTRMVMPGVLRATHQREVVRVVVCFVSVDMMCQFVGTQIATDLVLKNQRGTLRIPVNGTRMIRSVDVAVALAGKDDATFPCRIFASNQTSQLAHTDRLASAGPSAEQTLASSRLLRSDIELTAAVPTDTKLRFPRRHATSTDTPNGSSPATQQLSAKQRSAEAGGVEPPVLIARAGSSRAPSASRARFQRRRWDLNPRAFRPPIFGTGVINHSTTPPSTRRDSNPRATVISRVP